MQSMERASSIPRVVMQCNAMEGNRREGKVGKGEREREGRGIQSQGRTGCTDGCCIEGELNE